MLSALLILSYIGSLLGALGTTFIMFKWKPPYGIWIWVVGNGAMLIFTLSMGYYDQAAMWTYYQIVNILGLCQHYKVFDAIQYKVEGYKYLYHHIRLGGRK